MGVSNTVSADEKKAISFYVRKNGEAAIVCPECNTAKVVSVHKFRKRLFKLRVRCTCSYIFMAKLDYRQNYRKRVKFVGTISQLTPNLEEVVQILNISMGGICFRVTGGHDFAVEQRGEIEFFLDDKRRSFLKRAFHIKAIIGKTISCEFVHDLAYEKELGFYLRT